MRLCLAVLVTLTVAAIVGVGAAGGATQPTFHVTTTSPAADASSVSGTAAIRIGFSAPLSADSPLPTLSPNVPGSWVVNGSTAVFTPTGAYPPDGTVTVTVPNGSLGPETPAGGRLHKAVTFQFTVGTGSFLRAEQLLAGLGFLPVSWQHRAPVVRGQAEYERAAFHAPPGSFHLLGQFPPQLLSLWQEGATSLVWTSALHSFERAVGLPETSALTAAGWSDLLRLGYRRATHHMTAGFTYAFVTKQLPERLTIWQGGQQVFESLANTGIAESPTADGTFAVYLRFVNQVMSGTTPWGTTYSDPVSWVSYFNGSDADHYIYRYSYGYPQSLGCVELPLSAAERAWTFLQLGTLVTVSG